MGLLKHVILPLFAVLNLTISYQLLVYESIDDALESSQPFGRNTNPKKGGVPATELELHFLHALGGTFLCLGINMIVSMFSKSSTYRAMAVFLQVIFAAVDAYSYLRLEKDVPSMNQTLCRSF